MPPPASPLSQILPFFPITSSSPRPSTPILLALDFEAHEHPPYPITEIGLATLDPSLLSPSTATWPSAIKGTHIIISETSHLVNKDFLPGCPEDFRFGSSLIIPLPEAKNILTKALSNERGVVLIAHNLSEERRYLRLFLGEEWQIDTRVVMQLDTQRVVSTKKRLVGLGRMVAALGLEGGGMHNAGNDAGWTMRAVVEMVRREREEEGGLEGVVSGLRGGGEGVKRAKVWRKRKREESDEVVREAAAEAIAEEEKPVEV